MPDRQDDQPGIPRSPVPGFAAYAYIADAIWVVSGVNHGDPIGRPERLQPGDIYRIDPAAQPVRLMLRPAAGSYEIAEGSAIGRPGETVQPVARLTFMATDGGRVDILLLYHAAFGGLFGLPLAPMAPRTDYTLVEALDEASDLAIADLLCVAFAAGTTVTLADGQSRPIETLRPGEMVLTRDGGPQPVRWIGKATMRAQGPLAPVVISAGTLGNVGDLVVSPHHRIFLYRHGSGLTGPKEVLVQARYLVDGEMVWRREGGFVDYYSLIFDRHEVIFAEGVASESLMVNEATVARLPPEMAEDLRARFPGLSQRPHFGTDARRPQP